MTEDEGTILLREGTGSEIDVSIEQIKQFLMYVAQNRGLIPRQIAWEMNIPQNVIHAILESIEEAHDFVLKGYIAISDHARTPQWFMDLAPRQQARVPLWDGRYPSYFGPMPHGLKDRPDLHPLFTTEADAIFRKGFRTLGATPLVAKDAVAKEIAGLVGRMTTMAGGAAGASTARSFEEFSKLWNEKNKIAAEPPADLEFASPDDEDDETISLDYLIGFSTSHIRQRTRENPPQIAPAPVAPAPVAPAPVAPIAHVAPMVAPMARMAPVAPTPPKAPIAPTASLFPNAPVAPRVNQNPPRGINQQGSAKSYENDTTRKGRIALMTYLDPDMHARLKAWALFSDSTLTKIAADAINDYVERNGIPKLDEY